MVESATCIIRELGDERLHELEQDQEARKHIDLWEDMQKGILDAELLNILWDGSRAQVKDKLLLLMEKFDLIIPMKPKGTSESIQK